MVENYKELLYDNEVLETERLVLRKFKKSDSTDIVRYGITKERWLSLR